MNYKIHFVVSHLKQSIKSLRFSFPSTAFLSQTQNKKPTVYLPLKWPSINPKTKRKCKLKWTVAKEYGKKGWVCLKIEKERERNSHPSLRFSSLNFLGMWSKDWADRDLKHLLVMVLLKEEGEGKAEKSFEPWRKGEGPTWPNARKSSMVDEGGADSGERNEVAMERELRVCSVQRNGWACFRDTVWHRIAVHDN